MQEFDTPGPVRIRLEFGAGNISIEATDTTTTQVDLQPARDDDESHEAVAQTIIEHRGNDVIVKAPRKSGLFRRTPTLLLRMVVPSRSQLSAQINSADLVVTGELGTCDVATGSGEVSIETIGGDARLTAGSGDVTVRTITGRSQVRTGSGEIRVEQVDEAMTVATGSGDVTVGRVQPQLQAKSGSGDMSIGEADGEVSLASGSGDLQVRRIVSGRFSAKTASGDVHVGVADGTAAWLDLNSVSGDVDTSLEGADAPVDEERTVEVRATTVSGDVSVVRA